MTEQWTMPAGYPVLLAPMRLETRFSGGELLIRVIPDINADTHEPELTIAEQAAGTAYWVAAAAGDDAAATAWRGLVAQFGAPRAAWLARACRPGQTPATRSATWNRPALARALPTRWTAVGTAADGTPATVTGTAIQAGLPLGPDPANPAQVMPAWMSDFDTAVGCGMGLRLPLTPAMASGGLAQLVVFGVDESGDPAAGAAALGGLLDAHYFTDSLDYVDPGTPTNNTDTVPSGYDRHGQAWTDSLRPAATDPAGPVADSDAAVLVQALGTDPTGAGASLVWAAHPGAAEQQLAAGLQDALWAATWGYFITQMMPGTDDDFRRLDHGNVITDDAYLRSLDRARLWADVAAADALPAHPTQAQLAQVTADASVEWAARHDGDPFTAAGDWLGATRDLTADRIARYAYYQAQRRQLWYPGQPGEPLDDWLAGQTAAAWGPAVAASARAHVVPYLRPGGALPAISVGRQPYGLLVTTSLDRWAPAGTDAGLAALIRALRALRDDVWVPAATQVPQLAPDPVSEVTVAQQTLISLLATAPLCQQVGARPLLGPDYMRNVWRFAQPPLVGDWEQTTASSSGQLLFDLGIPWTPRVAQTIGAEESAPVTAPLADDDWVSWLTRLADPALTPDGLDPPAFGAADPATPLLYRLLRHALLREWADAAIALQSAVDDLPDLAQRDAELIDIDPVAAGPDVQVGQTWTLPRQLSRTVARPDGTKGTVGDYLAAADGSTDDVRSGLRRFRAALTGLCALAGTVGAPDLDRSLRQLLDATSHRLDAWCSSIAHRRLADLRGAQPAGLLTGGFGWVENLGPADPNLPADEPVFVFAPSVPQAVTAAVLRGGYDAYDDGQAAANPFAIDLRSSRVRLAEGLLDAARAGQPAGTATGYLFERRLQELGAGQYTAQFRALAPAAVTVLPADGSPAVPTPPAAADSIAPPQPPAAVTDGLRLRDLYQAGALAGLLKAIGDDDAGRAIPLLGDVTAALGALDDALDAAADLLLAESVHQLAGGNLARAGATLDTLAQGDTALPTPTVLTTPRSGLPLTHRVALSAPAAGTAPGWPAAAGARPYATACPELEELLRGLLPDPRTVAATVSGVTTAGTAATVTVTLDQLGLSATELVYATALAPPGAGPDLPATVSAGLLVAAASAAAPGLDTSQPVTITATAAPAVGQVPFMVFHGMCRLLRRLLGSGRALTAADLAAPGTGAADAADTVLAQRADTAAAALRTVAAYLPAAGTQAAGLELARGLGVPPAAEAVAAADDTELAGAVTTEVTTRLAALGIAEALPPGEDRETARLHAVFGAELLVLRPAVPVDAGTAAAFAAQPATPGDLRGWISTASRVRPALGDLRRVTTALTALGVRVRWTAAQLPWVTGEPWIGGSLDPGALAGPRASVTLLAAGPDAGDTLAGILVDEWVDVVPDTTQLAALAYRSPTPLSEPPQCLLLAVHPDPGGGPWTADVLLDVLRETLTLAKIRAVDPDSLPRVGQLDPDSLASVGQLLPATILATNTASPPDTPSTDVLFPA
jgi:hypothetical protein